MWGVQENRRERINLGMAGFAITIVAFFFSSVMDKLGRSASLILLGTIPVFALLMILGGIAPTQIAETMLVLGTTALAAGSLGGLVALWRDKTFQALAMTVLKD